MQLPHFLCFERAQRRNPMNRLGSKKPFAAILMNDCFSPTPKAEPRAEVMGLRIVDLLLALPGLS